jgi:hypothetical protein
MGSEDEDPGYEVGEGVGERGEGRILNENKTE